jgi:hypothetical protein
MSEQDSNRKHRRVVPAPLPSNPRLYSTVLSVECAEDEEVEWHWTETLEGRFVSGYRLVPRLRTLDCVFRSMPATGSGACRAMIPVHAGPPFRSMPARGCDAG